MEVRREKTNYICPSCGKEDVRRLIPTGIGAPMCCDHLCQCSYCETRGDETLWSYATAYERLKRKAKGKPID